MACLHGIFVDDQRLSITHIAICLECPGYVVSKLALSVVLAPRTQMLYRRSDCRSGGHPCHHGGKAHWKGWRDHQAATILYQHKGSFKECLPSMVEGLIRVLLSVLAMGHVRSS